MTGIAEMLVPLIIANPEFLRTLEIAADTAVERHATAADTATEMLLEDFREALDSVDPDNTQED